METKEANNETNLEIFPAVKKLHDIELASSVTPIEMPSNAITYDLSNVTNFEDKDAFLSKSNSFIQQAAAQKQYLIDYSLESTHVQNLINLLDDGKKMISVLYSYRRLSEALPKVAQDTPNEMKVSINLGNFNILRGEVLKIKEFMKFYDDGLRKYVDVFKYVWEIETRKSVQSQILMNLLVRGLDMWIILDKLKDMKPSLMNDFAGYKRAFASVRDQLDNLEQIQSELHEIQNFLTNPQHPKGNLIINRLRDDIRKIVGYEDMLGVMMAYVVEALNFERKKEKQEKYLLAEEKHGLLRCVPYLIFLCNNEDKIKKWKVGTSVMQKIMDKHPILPLCVDMKIAVFRILSLTDNWNSGESGDLSKTFSKSLKTGDEEETEKLRNSKKAKKTYLLLAHHARIRKEYKSFTVEFTCLMNEIKSAKHGVSVENLKRVMDVVLQGFRYLNSWNAQIIEQCAWKYEFECKDDEFKDRIGEQKIDEKDGNFAAVTVYGKVCRYNYTPHELHVLVDVIGMLKGLGSLMMKAEAVLVPLIRQGIHDDVQEFLQKDCARPLRKAYKKDKFIKHVMLEMRKIAGDWINMDAIEDYKNVKKDIIKLDRSFPRRCTAPTMTQISLIRRMMHTVFDDRNPGMGSVGFFGEKDLKPEWLETWVNFYDRSFFYPYLLGYSNFVQQSTDLSYLWYREWYLDLTKSMQFPIAMSLPWILTEYIIKVPSLKENIFYVMDIYNDAGNWALNVLSQQYLFDEIEAEVNVAFDQLIYLLSEDIFKYFKSLASSILLDRPTFLFALSTGKYESKIEKTLSLTYFICSLLFKN